MVPMHVGLCQPFLSFKPMSKSRECCSFNVVTDCTQTSNILSVQGKGTPVSISVCCQSFTVTQNVELRYIHEHLGPFSAEIRYEQSCNSTHPAICSHGLLRNIFPLQEGKISIMLNINPHTHTHTHTHTHIYIYMHCTLFFD